MKLTANREKLFAAFQSAAAVAPKRSPKPILQNVKLSAAKGGVTLAATDLEIGFSCPLAEVEVDAPGEVILPAARVGQILRELSDDTLRIETTKSGIKITGTRSAFTLPAEDSADFPAVRRFDSGSYFEVDAELLRILILRTVFACDTQGTRYALGGVKLERRGDNLYGIATDGRRLAKMDIPALWVGEPELPAMAVVPQRALQIIARSTKLAGQVKLAVCENDLIVDAAGVVISARLLEGRFPRWQDVLPKRDATQKIEIEVGELLHAVKQAAIVTSDESRGVDFAFTEGTLVLTGQTAEVGESKVELPIMFDGPPVAITLDPRFLVDFLTTLAGDDTFTLCITDSDHAALLTRDDGYDYVAMPLSRA